MSEEEILDIKRENYKLRKENFELIQDNVKLNDEINTLKIRLKEKICFESNSQFKDLKDKLYIQEGITEKWVKIAEKLAEEVEKVSLDNKEYILDWARKEIEKDDDK